MFTVQDIKDHIELVAIHGIRGIEVERSGFRLKIEGARAHETPPTMVTRLRLKSPMTFAKGSARWWR